MPGSNSFAGITAANPRAGAGSVELRKSDGPGSAFLREIPAPGFGTYGDLSAFSYEWYIQSTGAPTALPPEVALRVYDYGDPRSFFLVWNNCSPEGGCDAQPTGSWQATDLLARQSIQQAEGNPPPASLTEIPDDAPITGIHIRASYAFGQAWHGYVDNVTLGFRGRQPTTYNFEPRPGTGAELWTLNYTRFGTATDPERQILCDNRNGPPCSGTTAVPTTGFQAEYFSDSSASYGELRAKARVSVTGTGNPVPASFFPGVLPKFLSVGGNANYRETITVTGGTGPGTLQLRFRVTGTSSRSSGQSGRAQFQRVTFTSTGAWQETSYLPDVNGLVSIPLSFIFEQPLDYMIRFYALAQIYRYEPGAFATADYSAGAVLDQIWVLDASGIEVRNVGISASSGTEYSGHGVALPVEIDVKPGDGRNPINLRSRGVTPVAVLSGPEFDAPTTVDPASLTFGALGVEHSLVSCKGAEDVNGDGWLDLVCHFDTQKAGFAPHDTGAVLEGQTVRGDLVRGTAPIVIVGR